MWWRGKYEQQVTTSRQDVKPENKEKNKFTDLLQDGVNPEIKIVKNDIDNITNEGELNKYEPNKKYSLPDNVLY